MNNQLYTIFKKQEIDIFSTSNLSSVIISNIFANCKRLKKSIISKGHFIVYIIMILWEQKSKNYSNLPQLYMYTVMYKIDGVKSQNVFFIYHKRYCLFLDSLFLCKQEDDLSRSCINKKILLWHFKWKWPLKKKKNLKKLRKLHLLELLKNKDLDIW